MQRRQQCRLPLYYREQEQSYHYSFGANYQDDNTLPAMHGSTRVRDAWLYYLMPENHPGTVESQEQIFCVTQWRIKLVFGLSAN
jgi:hypothetical protein